MTGGGVTGPRKGWGAAPHLHLEPRELVAECLHAHARLLQLLARGAGRLVVLVRAQPGAVQLGLEGLLQLLAVQPQLLGVLVAQLLQCLCQLQVAVLLPATVHLYQPALVLPPRLPHLLLKHALAEVQLLLQALQPVLQVHAHQCLPLQLLLGHCVAILCLGQLGPQLGCIALQPVLVAEGSSQLGLAAVERGLQILHAALGHRQLSLPLLSTLGGLVQLGPYLPDLDLQACALPRHLIQHPPSVSQLRLVQLFNAADLTRRHLLLLGDPQQQPVVLQLERADAVDVMRQAVVELAQLLLLL